jgi:hypothetical protein
VDLTHAHSFGQFFCKSFPRFGGHFKFLIKIANYIIAKKKKKKENRVCVREK